MGMAKRSKPRIHQMTIAQFEQTFVTEDDCASYLHNHRWPDGVRCPRCGNENVHPHGSKPWHWQCYQCSSGSVGYRFSVLVGTIFENTNKPLRQWFRVIHLMLTSKKGISALQIQRMLGFGSYQTAWLMCHKIRAALGNVEFRQLVGYVEVDETFVGGKAKNKHKGPGGRGNFGGTGGTGKEIVVGAVQRTGNVIARVIANTKQETLDRFVRETVSHRVSLISTDKWKGYNCLDGKCKHGVVRHGQDEYVAGAIHTNTIEGFFSIFKRGIIGTFHKVSKKYLQLYVNEFEVRYNNRHNDDIFGTAIAAC
jgi:transposase-like protein